MVVKAHQHKQIQEARLVMVDAALYLEKAFYMSRTEVFPTEERAQASTEIAASLSSLIDVDIRKSVSISPDLETDLPKEF